MATRGLKGLGKSGARRPPNNLGVGHKNRYLTSELPRTEYKPPIVDMDPFTKSTALVKFRFRFTAARVGRICYHDCVPRTW